MNHLHDVRKRRILAGAGAEESLFVAAGEPLAHQPLGDTSHLAATMNRLLYRSTGTSSYATFFYGQFDEEKRELRYVNAGHNPPYVLRHDGTLDDMAARILDELKNWMRDAPQFDDLTFILMKVR